MRKLFSVFVLGILSVVMAFSKCDATRVRRKFEPEEDVKLKQLIEQHGQSNWERIANLMGNNRNARQCRERWKHYLSVDYNRMTPFSEEEDRLIIDKVKEFGCKWTKIAKLLKGRSDLDVKNRYCKLKASFGRIVRPNLSMIPRNMMLESKKEDNKQENTEDKKEGKKIEKPIFDNLGFDGLDFDGMRSNDSWFDLDGQYYDDGQR